ncbi:MAG: AmmeMemoRadiSam system protein B [Candidatus Saccharicenans sp.]|uniref:AmmeMemoRadiSam system protein B n=1 Tax=Candidatus Saccharicenans sp. TaxID=2819258 RepID=UPI00404A50DE
MNRILEKISGPLKLRTDLEIQILNYHGQRALLVSDRLGLIKNPVLLQGEALEVLGLIDGRRELEDIRLEFLRQRGYSLLESSLVNEILESFYQLWLLDTPEFQARRQSLIQEFMSWEIREPALAGEAYPNEQSELKKFLGQILELEKLPPEIEAELRAGNRPAVLIAPHIDLRRGYRLYSRVYACLYGQQYRRVLVLGTGHILEGGVVSLSAKDFATPFGRIRTDREVVSQLREAAGGLAAPDDFAHKKEHSIEFQLLFLQHLLGNDFQLVPVLFGSINQWLETAGRASDIPGYLTFLKELRKVASEPETLVVAGVDFSHAGPKFGHKQPVSAFREEVLDFDRRIVQSLLHRQPESFWRLLQENGDRFNLCGFPTLAALMEIMTSDRGYLLGHEMVDEPATGSAVSFAALVYF